MMIDLSSELQRFVDQLIAEGQYPTPDAVIEAALRSFADSELRREAQRGMDQIRQGLDTRWDVNEVISRIAKFRLQGAGDGDCT